MNHLDVKTDYSFLRGYGKPDQVIERAVNIGATAIGIADWCSTWGHVPLWTAARGKPLKVLYGVTVPVVPTLNKDPRNDVVTLIAKTNDGLAELYSLMTTAHEQTYYRPRLSWRQVQDAMQSVHVIATDVHLSNFDYLRHGMFIGVQPKLGTMLRAALSGEYKAVLSMSPRFPHPTDKPAMELMQAISAGKRIGEAPFEGCHLTTLDETKDLFSRLGIKIQEDWLDHIDAIVEECNAQPQKARNVVPSRTRTLRELCEQGAALLRVDLSDSRYGERLNRELDVIKEKDFEDYFHLVTDLVSWAKDRMLVGPGRGSSGGSLVCYLLGITTIDPIVHGTLFERFIDITRNDWPDIDIDFPDVTREQVFDYLRDKYGEDRVARIGTVSEFGAKSALNDTGKALGVSWDIIREATRYVDGTNVPLSAMVWHDDLAQIYAKAPALKNAERIEGHARHSGVHAAGVIVAQDPVRRSCTVNREGTACVTLEDAERLNLLKIDALGLRTLTVITEACEMAGLDPFKLYEMKDFTDEQVYKIFQQDLVTGVFQFEGFAVRQLMKAMTVDRFEDLVALVALARPGPLEGGAAGEYVSRRSGHRDWDYEHPLLEPITRDTYGTIVYQEQVMAIVRDIGGFDVVEVNKFRKAVGKKDPETLKGFRERWTRGSVDRLGDKIAGSLWEQMCEFGSYAFNKSHSVAYAIVAYWCAWLKAYFGKEFAVAQLRHAKDDDQARALLRELQNEGHEFVPFDPDISEASWSIQDGRIYGGYTSVIGIGQKTAEAMIEKRKEHGKKFLFHLTQAQRAKILAPNNTPWYNLNRCSKLYGDIYEHPERYNVRGRILRISSIPENTVGNYCFIAKLVRKQLKEKAGKPYLNLFWEDDTGEVGSTINRFKYDALSPLVAEEKDFLVRGNIIEGGRGKWIFIENLKELDDAFLAQGTRKEEKQEEPQAMEGAAA
jgi:DNA polymerase III alpha subunit